MQIATVPPVLLRTGAQTHQGLALRLLPGTCLARSAFRVVAPWEPNVRTTAPQHNIPLPLILMSRPRRSRAKELAAVAGLAVLLLAATSHQPEERAPAQVMAVAR